MRALILALFAVTAAAAAAAAADPPAEAAAEEGAKTEAVTAAAEDKPFEPPPGFKPKKRGKYTVYCRKDTAMGTRLPSEVCYDEDGIRAMLQAQREDRELVDQQRRICSSQATCGAN